MSAFQPLEDSLNDIFAKDLPPLPSNAKKIIVAYLPYINLVLGLLTLMAAWGLYRAAQAVNAWVDYTNAAAAAYGGKLAVNHLTFMVWVSIAVLIAEAALYVAAYPATKARKKSGWDLLFYALLINVVYGVAVLFTYYGGFSRLLSSLIGSAVGFYFLFQIRGSYRSGRARSSKRS